ncbi:ATP-binding protein [Streptomyces sp. NBC_01341]|uniref:ATP-binding protein n=1 Tax=Streptomyces sp. NBC_01341 TaxID=2903831 RepID=UPI002E0E860D|nr:ATP-binding protein [Streptomyces sp. NBC_01341]
MTVIPLGKTAPPPSRADRPARPRVCEVRLDAFASHRRTVIPLDPFTLLTGGSGSGKSSALRGYEALARLAAGEPLAEVFPDPAAWVPEWARADAQGRRGFRIGCTVDGPAGRVRLDLAVQAEPALRIVGERLADRQETLFSTALREPRRATVQAAWHSAGTVPVTRAPFPGDRLGTALLPLRVAGATGGELRMLAASEQVVVALRSVFVCDPQPARMRAAVPAGEGRLTSDCGNLAEVLHRTRALCARRYARLVAGADTGCAGPVTGLTAERLADGTTRARMERGPGPGTPLGRLGDGELRYLALTLAVLTGSRAMAADPHSEVPSAMRAVTVLADGLDRNLDTRQTRELLTLAAAVCGGGHTRLLGTVGEAAAAVARAAGVTVVDLAP